MKREFFCLAIRYEIHTGATKRKISNLNLKQVLTKIFKRQQIMSKSNFDHSFENSYSLTEHF